MYFTGTFDLPTNIKPHVMLMCIANANHQVKYMSSNRETAFFLEPAKPVWSQWSPSRRPRLQGPFSIHWRRPPNAYRMEHCDRSGTKSRLLSSGRLNWLFQPIRVIPATEPGTFYCTCNMTSRSGIKGGATLNSGHLALGTCTWF